MNFYNAIDSYYLLESIEKGGTMDMERFGMVGYWGELERASQCSQGVQGWRDEGKGRWVR